MHWVPNRPGDIPGINGGERTVLDWWDILFWRWQTFVLRLRGYKFGRS